jgi:holin-like protein
MIRALTALLLCQLVGEIIARLLQLPVPGPVIGMLLLWILLLIHGSIPAWLQGTAQTIVQHLSLLFVPAGVGVMVHFSRLQDEWLPILLTLLGSTIITMVVTALTMHVLSLQMNRMQ